MSKILTDQQGAPNDLLDFQMVVITIIIITTMMVMVKKADTFVKEEKGGKDMEAKFKEVCWRHRTITSHYHLQPHLEI